jgi:hypothetical protein
MKLSQLHFYGVQALTALSNFEFNFVFVADFVDQLAYVYEDVLAGLVHFDETKTFGLVEEFYSSCLHGTFVIDDFFKISSSQLCLPSLQECSTGLCSLRFLKPASKIELSFKLTIYSTIMP